MMKQSIESRVSDFIDDIGMLDSDYASSHRECIKIKRKILGMIHDLEYSENHYRELHMEQFSKAVEASGIGVPGSGGNRGG
jgi:hypothetical protein